MRIRLVAAGFTLAALAALTACSGSGSDDMGTATADTALQGEGGAAGGDSAEMPAAEAAPADRALAGGAKVDSTSYENGQAPLSQAVIRTGSVSLRSDDVAETRFEVQELVDEHKGQISDDKTETDKTGAALRSRMVLRVPSADFDDVMDRLGKLAILASTSTTSQDVTTQLIDVEAQIAVQERSVSRVRTLLTRAESIRDIMAIEAELANRQAQLDSLTQQRAWLKDQTSMATISVHLQRTEKAAATPKKEDRTGFLAGLSAGWDGLQGATTAVLTAVGALLPFAAVAAVIGIPVLLLVRRIRSTPPIAPSAPAGPSD